MKKICTNCGEERDGEQDFTWKYRDRGIRQTRCKFCLSQVSKEHYQNNKQSYLDRGYNHIKRWSRVKNHENHAQFTWPPPLNVVVPDRVRAREILIIEDNQKRLADYLAHHPCVDCGFTDIRVLEFDHVRGKKSGNISRMVGLGYSWSTIVAEIAKCEVRCANCHRIRESEKGSSWRRFLAFN